MDKAKDVLERLEAMHKQGLSGLSILTELQELILLAPSAVQEVYQAEIDMERLVYYERGQTA